VLSLVSCGSDGCSETRETFCYAVVESKIGTVGSNMYVWNNDTLIASASNPSSFECILNPSSDQTTLHIQLTIADTDSTAVQLDDTLLLRYEAVPYLLNMECGCSVYFNLHEVKTTHHFIKEITLLNKEITNEEDVNLRIEY